MNTMMNYRFIKKKVQGKKKVLFGIKMIQKMKMKLIHNYYKVREIAISQRTFQRYLNFALNNIQIKSCEYIYIIYFRDKANKDIFKKLIEDGLIEDEKAL